MLLAPNLFQRVSCGGSQGFLPGALPGLELYLSSRLGTFPADGANLATWKDQSGNARDASSTSASIKPVYHTTGATLSPNGSPTVRFSGGDGPAADCWMQNAAAPAVWPSIAAGYTFYAVFRQLTPAGAAGCSLLFAEGGTNALRLVTVDASPNQRPGWRDELSQHDAAEAFSAGWQSMRWVWRAAGTVDLYRDRVLLTVAPNTYSFNPGGKSAYALGQLSTNLVCGFTGDLGAFLWYSREHDLATQTTVDNYLRSQFGLT